MPRPEASSRTPQGSPSVKQAPQAEGRSRLRRLRPSLLTAPVTPWPAGVSDPQIHRP
jgi:hypothetical protein